MLNEEILDAIERALDHRFENRGFLVQALTHRTWIEERHPGGQAPAHLDQERLEFLGDALLNYAVAHWLMHALPTADEGELTERRKQFTEGGWLTQLGRDLGVGDHVLRGKGEAARASSNQRLLEDTVEAIVGAVVLDAGHEEAMALVAKWLPKEPPPLTEGDPLVAFNLWHQQKYRTSPPKPHCTSMGSDHEKTWCAEYEIEGVPGVGYGKDKQAATREACRDLLARLGVAGWESPHPP